jgi:hypothetical protein
MHFDLYIDEKVILAKSIRKVRVRQVLSEAATCFAAGMIPKPADCEVVQDAFYEVYGTEWCDVTLGGQVLYFEQFFYPSVKCDVSLLCLFAIEFLE